MPRTVVVVGASVGGVRTAQALRREGHDGPIVLVGAEPHLPYDKPPLSKHFLAGVWDLERVSLLTAAEADIDRIDLRLGVAAVRLDIADHAVVLADDSRVRYDVVVLATGAAARPSPWHPESGLYIVRNLDDGHRLKAALAGSTGPVVVVGGGFIGAEVAATAHAAGHHVTVVDPQVSPIGRVLGDEIGALFATVHTRHGVDTRFGVGVQDVTGRAGDLQVTLTDGEVLPAEIVVVGIGATPNVDWLTSSGLDIDNGVLCDEFCRAVGAADVFAVGDVARWFHPAHGDHVRVEHWTNAVEQAVNVAHNIIHSDSPSSYRPDEYVWSDQYDWKIQIVGRPHVAEGHDVFGDTTGSPPRFAVLFHGPSSQFVGAATVNWPKALATCRRLLAARADIGKVREAVSALSMGKAPVAASGSRP
jgi:NADPH-dependent 2,4-dienoyl-CoA reductase/sulfur reductase-like enzyme